MVLIILWVMQMMRYVIHDHIVMIGMLYYEHELIVPLTRLSVVIYDCELVLLVTMIRVHHTVIMDIVEMHIYNLVLLLHYDEEHDW